MREKLVSESGSASRSEEQNKLLLSIEQLEGHIKKLENALMINKLKYAEDESYWCMKEKNYRVELDSATKQFKKEKSELL